MSCQPGGELRLRQGAEVLQGGAPEHFVEAGRVGRDLLLSLIHIYALREEGDGRRAPSAYAGRAISIHALREEGDRPSEPVAFKKIDPNKRLTPIEALASSLNFYGRRCFFSLSSFFPDLPHTFVA